MADAFAETLHETEEMLNNPGLVLAIEPVSFGIESQSPPTQSAFFQHLAGFAPSLIEDATLADLTALHRMGVACRLCGQFDMAERFYRRALALIEAESGCHSLAAAAHRNFLAGLFFMTGRESESIPLIEASLHTYIKNLDDRHLYTRLTHFGLALAFARISDTERAQDHYLRSELGSTSRLEAVDELRWSALPLKLMSLAAVKFEQRRLDESVELFRHCVIHEANEAWPGSMVVARALGNLATLCRSQGLDAEAGEFFRMTLKMKGDLMEADNPDYQVTLKQYQDFLKATAERRSE
ncbi:MAG: tetratricopeptide repeat protein [Candidatus Obscuribacterales bacterium]|jgi:tetratricopeptide (TPR) repeat protein